MKKANLLIILLTLLALASFHVLASATSLRLGSIQKPTPEHAYIMLQWMLWGTLSMFLLTIFLVQSDRFIGKTNHILFKTTQVRFITYSSVFALFAAIALRVEILQLMPITDDEACYGFMSNLLLSGRLTGISHPARLFFDHIFLVNDGSVYSHFFIGWPALLVLDRLLGSAGFINAVFVSLTIPLLHSIAKETIGIKWARVSVLLFVTSPLILVGAATTLSHTSMMLLLCAAIATFQKASKTNSMRHHLLFIASASGSFFVRPYTALAFLLLPTLWWLWMLVRNPKKEQFARQGPAIMLGVVMLAIFFSVLQVQTGHFLTSPYKAYENYSRLNGCRFSIYRLDLAFSHLHYNPRFALSQLSCGLLRMNFALFGWPCSLLFIFFAPKMLKTSVLWACLLSFLVFHAFISDPGIDTYGPTHYSEVSIAAILLTAGGMRQLDIWLARMRHAHIFANLSRIPLAICLALVIVSWLGYIPLKLATIHTFSSLVREAQTLENVPEEKSVIFVSSNASNYGISGGGNGYVFARPCNDPDLQNKVLWANHLTLEDDRILMDAFFPDRIAYFMIWKEDRAYLIPLKQLPDNLPYNKYIGDPLNSIDWSEVEMPSVQK
jgi:hypothetical protein